jgi:hypothetical protein
VSEHAINDASWIRARLPHTGTYTYSAQIASDTIITYELRVAPVLATGASWPIAVSATLTIEGDKSARIGIAPAAMTRKIASDSAWLRFAVAPGTYRVLLVRDTTYVACRIPCRNPRRFVLHPAHNVLVRP